ncbi:hypothetical protein [uncultured Methylophaga sp.]|uniref:hypothetical protein n=1 Tax=uncultured Methylophaga sp. TaxID=285271 RepID=UPI0030D94B33
MREILLRYWSIYGGWKAIFKSGYFWIAFVLSLAMYSQWACTNGWWEDILSIMPNMLGFSLGGYAMWLAIGDDDFRALISGQDEDGSPSPYMQVNAAFVHFIMLQIISIIGALLVQAFYKPIVEEFSMATKLCEIAVGSYLLAIWYWFTYLIFIYAIMSAMAATFSLLRVSSWYDIHQTEKMKKKNDRNEM